MTKDVEFAATTLLAMTQQMNGVLAASGSIMGSLGSGKGVAKTREQIADWLLDFDTCPECDHEGIRAVVNDALMHRDDETLKKLLSVPLEMYFKK